MKSNSEHDDENMGPHWTSVRQRLSTRGTLNFAFGLCQLQVKVPPLRP